MMLWLSQRRTCAQTFQFWRCLTNQMTHHPVERAVWLWQVIPLFREQSSHALSRQDAARWADLGTYRE